MSLFNKLLKSIFPILFFSTILLGNDYTLNLSTSIINSKYTKSSQESDSNGYTSIASLSKNFSNDLTATGILGYSKTDSILNQSGNDAENDITVNTYGISILKVLNPAQFVNISMIYSDSGVTTTGTMNSTSVNSSQDASSLTSTLSFIQFIPLNEKFFTTLNIALSNQERKTDSYTTASSTSVSATSSTLTYATFGINPTYIINNQLSAGMSFQYNIADKSFLSGVEDMNYYTVGLNVNKELSNTWSIGFNANKQYGLAYSASDSIGLNLSYKF